MDHEVDAATAELGGEGASRREFIKKAGVVAGATAWAVPTMQIINMAGASAQTNGSVVDPTRPPSSTTTRPPTTHPPKCDYWKATAIWHCEEPDGHPGAANDGDGRCLDGYWMWVDRSGPCIKGYPNRVPPKGVYFGRDSNMYRAHVGIELRGCKLVAIQAPYGDDGCLEGQIVDGGYGAVIGAPVADDNGNGHHGLKVIEVLIECCADNDYEE
ncbi:MAG: hypothetical protein GY720_12520 [bacterium]|nr:hypothetical protein [bacterium]